MSNEGKAATEEKIALYDAIERAITNVHAALAEIDAAWVRITAERPNPSASAFKLETQIRGELLNGPGRRSRRPLRLQGRNARRVRTMKLFTLNEVATILRYIGTDRERSVRGLFRRHGIT